MPRICAVDVVDVRFPTSATLIGWGAMHPDGDYSAVVDRGRCRLPMDPGYSSRMHPGSVAMFSSPHGAYWRDAPARR